MKCNDFGLHTFLQDFLQVDYFPSISVLYQLQTQEELKTLRLNALFVAVDEGMGRIMSVKILNLEELTCNNVYFSFAHHASNVAYTRARGDG